MARETRTDLLVPRPAGRSVDARNVSSLLPAPISLTPQQAKQVAAAGLDDSIPDDGSTSGFLPPTDPGGP